MFAIDKIVIRLLAMSIKKYLEKSPSILDKQIIVTGATSGIGLSLTDHLLYKGAKVIILARNENKALEVKKSMLEKYPNGQIDIIKFDQSDFENITKASEVIIKDYPNFDAIVLNAGIFCPSQKEEDMSLTIKTNYVGLAKFMESLLPYLKGKHRFIFQGSFVAGWHNKKINSLKEKNLTNFQQYIISKSGVEALFYHYYKENDNPDLSFLCCEPGLTSTDIVRDLKTPIRQLGKLFMKIVSHSPKKASLTALKALDDSLNNGAYIVPRGLLTYMGYPKIKKFPKKRRRENLYYLLKELDQ